MIIDENSLPSRQTDAQGPLNREIRVLDLLPGRPDDELNCEIRIVNLDESPQYEAVSYCWGDLPAQQGNIKVSDRPTSVTPNLYNALRWLRHSDKKRTLWIDQLCINQWDMKEKATQVSLMRDIYRNCSHCVLWLGEIPDSSHGFSQADAESAFTFIKTVAEIELDLTRQPLEFPWFHRHEGVRELPAMFQDSPKGEAVRKAFAAFAMYGNPWWTRVWTIQEAILPNSAEFVWGSLTVSRDNIMLATRRLKSGPSGFTHCFSGSFQHCKKKYKELLRFILYPVYGFIHTLNGQEPLDLLMRWRHRQATDPRDKVYALLGLLPLNVLPSAQPCSYSISIPDLFSKVTLDLIRHERCLRPLVGSSEIMHQTPDLPSWAIDFVCSNRVGRRQLKWWSHSHRYKEFTASGKYQLQLSTSNSGNIISLTGVQIDQVVKVNEVYTLADDQSVLRPRIRQFLLDARNLLNEFRNSQKDLIKYPGGGTWDSALWRTMIGDLIMDEYPVQRANASHEHDFEQAQEGIFNVKPELPNVVLESLYGMIPNHAFFITERGYIGIGPPWTAPGDQVWVFYGGRVPFMMRPTREGDYENHLQLVGDSYVHGMMDGAAILEGHQAQTIWIH